MGEQPQRGRAGVRVARPRVAGALSATAVLALGRARLPDAAGLAALLGCDCVASGREKARTETEGMPSVPPSRWLGVSLRAWPRGACSPAWRLPLPAARVRPR